ncbi:hypothetical protein GCM10022226_14640 [Sphaerisporangium flaviroseum]|uniref:Alkaline shock response membrane anchor protein AmaP n=1 Tax=Sphaerisporangium flaviroseum TaxID=509199 RepID=A0ABP7HJ20_9ACTN
MSHRTAVVNRIGLALVGLILLVAGAAALARGLGLASGLLGSRTSPVVSKAIAAYTARNSWFWPALAIVALLVTLLALRWLLHQARTGTIRYVNLEPDPGHGATHLSSRAAAAALEDDVADSVHQEGAARSERVHATLDGAPSAPHLALAVVLPDRADPTAARHGIQRAVDRLRRSLETDRLPATVQMHTTRTH